MSRCYGADMNPMQRVCKRFMYPDFMILHDRLRGELIMTRYIATIRGHDIVNSRIIQAGDTLADAKIAADHEFGDGFRHHTIVILDLEAYNFDEEQVAFRRIADKNWRRN